MKTKAVYTKHLHIILTPAEHETLRKASFSYKVSIGQIIRDLIRVHVKRMGKHI
jgi:hypothetical protein